MTACRRIRLDADQCGSGWPVMKVAISEKIDLAAWPFK
jgi:hypothetical protein